MAPQENNINLTRTKKTYESLDGRLPKSGGCTAVDVAAGEFPVSHVRILCHISDGNCSCLMRIFSSAYHKMIDGI